VNVDELEFMILRLPSPIEIVHQYDVLLLLPLLLPLLFHPQ
jgi:hypothetical protein